MKKPQLITISIIAMVALVACHSESTNDDANESKVTTTTTKAGIKITDFNISAKIDSTNAGYVPGWDYVPGEVIEYEPCDSFEREMVKQFNDYHQTLYSGDAERHCKYMWPDYVKEVGEKVLAEGCEEWHNTYEQHRRIGMDKTTVVAFPIRRLDYKGTTIYLLAYNTNTTFKGKKSHLEYMLYMLALTKDNGKQWWFANYFGNDLKDKLKDYPEDMATSITDAVEISDDSRPIF